MKRREFIIGVGAGLAGAAGVAACLPKDVYAGKGGGEDAFRGEPVQPARTAEVLYFDRWAKVGSIEHLKAGDVFRLREPDGELIDDDADVALGAPFKTVAGKDSWTWGIECAGGWWPWALATYGDRHYGCVEGLEAVYLATMPDPLPKQAAERFKDVPFVRPGAPLIIPHYDGYPDYMPTYEDERIFLHALRKGSNPDSVIFNTALIRKEWGVEGMPTCIPNQAAYLWSRSKIFIARYAEPGVY